MSGIKLSQLRAFQAIMATGSLTSAATKLNLTQPAVSKQLAALEYSLDMRLFNRRRGGPMVPTRQAAQLFREIECTLSGIDTIPTLAKEINLHSKARLRIAATPPLMNSRPFMKALASLRSKHPNLRLSLESRHRLDIEEWLIAGQIDLGLALLPAVNPDLVGIPLVETQVVAVVPAASPLARLPFLSEAHLVGENLILPSRQLLREYIDHSFHDAKLSLSADIETSSAITCCSLVAAGLGVALCDPFSPTGYFAEGLVLLPWEPSVTVTYGVIMRRERDVDEDVEVLLTELRSQFASFRIKPR